MVVSTLFRRAQQQEKVLCFFKQQLFEHVFCIGGCCNRRSRANSETSRLQLVQTSNLLASLLELSVHFKAPKPIAKFQQHAMASNGCVLLLHHDFFSVQIRVFFIINEVEQLLLIVMCKRSFNVVFFSILPSFSQALSIPLSLNNVFTYKCLMHPNVVKLKKLLLIKGAILNQINLFEEQNMLEMLIPWLERCVSRFDCHLSFIYLHFFVFLFFLYKEATRQLPFLLVLLPCILHMIC